jgi:SAM-dependent methyltransferase
MPAHNTYSSLWFQLFMPLQTEEWTEKDVAFLARHLPLPRYKRVLDLCCGYGRHAARLAARGYTVTGLDRDAAALEEARRQTLAAHQQVTYVLGDMRELSALPGGFDAVINMWQSLSYFDEATNMEMLRQIAAKLAPAGRFVVDMYNRDYFERNQGHKSQQINGVTIETEAYMEGNRWHSVLTYRDAYGAPCGEDHMDWQLYKLDEFTALAGECGFTSRLACTFSDETIAPSPEIGRMQLVLEKR